MSSRSRSPTQTRRDPDLAGAEAAMLRAARRARTRADAAARAEEEAAVVDALRALRGAGLDGGASHLRNASSCINAGDWAGSVRESIRAVESVARQLDPAASGALSPALRSLRRSGALHPALETVFHKLCGYTSDERGIRPALLDESDADLGMDEAVFMLGACASFASYLWRKHSAGKGVRALP